MAHAQSSKKTNLSLALLLVVVAALGLRFWRIDIPFVEPYNSIARQSIVASVARNFYEGGFRFFYPEINENGPGPYLYNAEMPFYSYIMALGYQIAGRVHEGVARSVSVVFSLITLFLLYRMTRRIFDEKIALFALAFASLSPLYLAISRSLQPEAAFLAGSMGAVYFFWRYLDTQKGLDYWLSAACLSFAVATKFFNVYLLGLIVIMAWRAKGFVIFKEIKNYLYIGVVCASFIWYWQMWKAGQAVDLAYYPYRYIAHRADAAGNEIEHFHFLPSFLQCLKIFTLHILTPLGCLFFLVGFVKGTKRKEEEFLYVWLALTLLTLVVGWKTVIQHSYYQIPLILPAAFFVAKGLRSLLSDPGFMGRLARNRAIWVIALLLEAASLLYLYRGLYFIPEKRMAIVRAGEATDKLIPKDALLIASHETSAIQLYYAHRRGWQFSVAGRDAQTLIRELEARRQKGAKYFLTSTLNEMREVPEFENYLRKHYKLLQETKEFLLFDLTG